MHGGFHCKPGARELILPPDSEACMWHFSYHTIEDTHRVNARLEEVLGLPRPVSRYATAQAGAVARAER